MPTTIVNYNEETINFLEDVNYGMSKPQFNHLATIIEALSILMTRYLFQRLQRILLRLKIEAVSLDF